MEKARSNSPVIVKIYHVKVKTISHSMIAAIHIMGRYGLLFLLQIVMSEPIKQSTIMMLAV